MNTQRLFDTLQQQRIGKYIYALRDPRDKKGAWIKLNPKTSMHYVKKGYDLNKKELSVWLSENYPNNTKGKPRKLKFDLSVERDVFNLNFISEIK